MKGAVLVLVGVTAGLAGGLIAPMFSSDKSDSGKRAIRSTSSDAELADLRGRVEVLERQRAERPAPPERADAEVRPPVDAYRRKAAPARTPGKPASLPEDVKAYVARLLTTEMTNAAANKLFQWLTVNKSKINATISELEKAVKEDPQNPELQVALATAYVAQLTNDIPAGPQRGLVWMKASNAYDAAIKVKPEHWQARYGKAFGVSMVPEFLGFKPVAIQQFEELRRIQEQRAPEPQHVQTYFRLGTLYKNMGNAEKARDVWEHGLKLFPDDKTLTGALEASTKR